MNEKEIDSAKFYYHKSKQKQNILFVHEPFLARKEASKHWLRNLKATEEQSAQKHRHAVGN